MYPTQLHPYFYEILSCYLFGSMQCWGPFVGDKIVTYSVILFLCTASVLCTNNFPLPAWGIPAFVTLSSNFFILYVDQVKFTESLTERGPREERKCVEFCTCNDQFNSCRRSSGSMPHDKFMQFFLLNRHLVWLANRCVDDVERPENKPSWVGFRLYAWHSVTYCNLIQRVNVNCDAVWVR